ncbi:hypothetical protein ACOME3_008419 [Neoechinorhynchus agilis]
MEINQTALSIEGAYLDAIPSDLNLIIPQIDRIFIMPRKYSDEHTTLTKTTLNKFRHLKYFRIQDFGIKIIEEGAFEGFQNLVELNLKMNNIHQLSSKMDQNLPRLESLILSNNKLTDDSVEIISKMKSLKTLDLSNNLIENVKISGDSALAGLKEINMHGNLLKKIEMTLNNLRSLEIDYSGNLADLLNSNFMFGQLTKLVVHGGSTRSIGSNLLTKIPKLKHFGVPGAQLTEIPRGNDVTNDVFETLILKGNQIETLKGYDLHNYHNLKRLDLSQNKISKIDERAFFELPNLRTLELDGNQLFELPFNLLENTKSLKVLSLSNNHLKNFDPNLLRNIEFLSFLSISGNQINELVAREGDMKRVGYFKVDNNGLSTITFDKNNARRSLMFFAQRAGSLPKSIATTLGLGVVRTAIEPSSILDLSSVGMTSLKDMQTFVTYKGVESLDASHNMISKIDVNDLNGMEYLMYMSLEFNKIQNIVPNVFNRFYKLMALDLSHNQLRDFDTPDTFKGLRSLLFLNLASNGLDEVPSKAISQLQSLTWLDISNNPIHKFFNAPFMSMKSLGRVNINETDISIVFGY